MFPLNFITSNLIMNEANINGEKWRERIGKGRCQGDEKSGKQKY